MLACGLGCPQLLLQDKFLPTRRVADLADRLEHIEQLVVVTQVRKRSSVSVADG
jgi:hypothetical protein